MPAKSDKRGTLRFLEAGMQDLRFALRQLSKSPSFTFTAVLVFALGVAASTAIFAFVDAALIRPLPYREPSRLVALYERIPAGDRFHLSYGDYLDWKRQNRVFTSLDVYRPDQFSLKTASGNEEVKGATVSDGFFSARLASNRFSAVISGLEKINPNAAQTVMLSFAAWRLRFAGSESVLGQTISLNGVPSLVIGVLPSGFHFAPVGAADYWTTLHWDREPRLGAPYYGVARLKDGVSVGAAYADVSSIARQIAAAYPRTNSDRSATLLPLADAIVGDIRPTLVALLSGAGLLSLVGFVNVSSLLLVRAESRRREIALRSALGASHSRILCQFAVEGFLLAGAGCAIGLLLTFCATRLLPGQIPHGLLDNMPYLRGLHLHAHVLLFAMMISITAGLLFSAAPSLQLLLSDMQTGLVAEGRTAVGRSWRSMGSSLVAAELAITVVLLVSAGLLAKSFYRLLHEDIGITADHLAVIHVLDPEEQTDARSLAIEHQIRQKMAALPGVVSVGASVELAVDSGESYTHSFEHFRVVGRSYVGQGDESIRRPVSIGYFPTLRARLLSGRYFAEDDDLTKPRVALINHTMATQVFPGEDPLGKSILGDFGNGHPQRIIGVIDDIKDGPLDEQQIPAVYTSLNQEPDDDIYVTVRTSQPEDAMLPAMVHVIHQIDGSLIANGEDTMANRINTSQSAYLHRSAAWIVAGFAALALLLGSVGLYGVISYSVGQRTREIGLRMALGAQRSGVYTLILKEACWLAALGITGGILCSFATANLLRRMLFGVGPWDVATMLSVVCVLAVSTLLASYIPAHRAASLNPTDALRAE